MSVLQEIELRLSVPAARVAALAQELAAAPGARRQLLRATYFDTPERALARAGWGLRLRWEGEAWVQTAKGPLAADGLSRPEHNVAIGATPGLPALDLQAHAALPELHALLQRPGGALRPTFGTEIERLRHEQTLPEGTRLELALDQGWLIAGARRAAVCELEIEHLDGPLAPLLALAQTWAARWDLTPQPLSKAARGHALLQD